MQVYDFTDYRSIVRHCLESGTPERPRSTKKSLADHMKCHATFISHVVADKAEFSMEQAVRFCSYYGIDVDSTDYFLDLIARDRAGDGSTREIYERRLRHQHDNWLTLQNRLKSEERLTGDQQRRYFESWLLQLVHLCCMIPNRNTQDGIVAALGLPPARVEAALRQLTAMGLLEIDGKTFGTRPKQIHLDRNSPTFKTCHGNWRLKIAADVSTFQEPEGIHYTSAITISRDAAEDLRKELLETIEKARAISVDSEPEEIYVMALDLYRVTPLEM